MLILRLDRPVENAIGIAFIQLLAEAQGHAQRYVEVANVCLDRVADIQTVSGTLHPNTMPLIIS